MPNRYRIYAASFLMDFVCAFVVGGGAVYAVELGATALELGLMGALGAALYVITSLAAGHLSDRFSRRKSLILYCSLALVSCVLLTRAATLTGLFIWYPMYHAVIGFYWPTVQSLLADSRHRRNLASTLGNFCISWSLGFTTGHYICGVLTRIDSRLPFTWSVVLSLLILVVAYSLSDFEGEQRMASADYLARSDGGNRVIWRKFLICGWLANFTLVFILSSAKMLFPKLALDVDHMDKATLGLMLALIHGGQLMVFWLAKYWHGWQYNRRVYLLTQLLALPGAGLLALSSNVFAYAAGMLLIGISCGFTYTSSIYYSTSRPPDSSTRTGYHEAFIGLGILLGPLSGGVVSDHWNLHSPYILCALLALVALALQTWLLYRPASRKSAV